MKTLFKKPLLKRLNGTTRNGEPMRVYTQVLENNEYGQQFAGVTSIVGAVFPIQQFIREQMILKHGTDWRQYLSSKADYGTTLHLLFEVLLNTQNVSEMHVIEAYYSIFGRMPNFETTQDLLSDVASLASFVHTHNVSSILLEAQLSGTIGGHYVAGTADLICEIDVEETFLDHENPYKSGTRKGEPRESKRVVRKKALIDLKSGKWGFSFGHVVQLNLYRMLLQQEFPNEYNNILLFNLSPKDWRGEIATYTLKEQEVLADEDMAETVNHFYKWHFEPVQPKKILKSVQVGETSYVAEIEYFDNAKEKFIGGK